MQTPLAIFASLLAVLIWLISRRRVDRVLAPAQRDSAALAPIAQVVAAAAALPAVRACEGTKDQLRQQLNRQQRLRACKAALGGDLSQRLSAVQQLSLQRDRAALPLLKQGLRDPHPAVVRAAAAAIEAYRGRPSAAATVTPARRLPRNAAPRAGSA